MDALLLLYNLILIILHSLPILLAALLYHREKKPLYCYLIALFSVYILDSLILYLSDFAASFSMFYKKFFYDVPTLKTLVYVVSFFCIIKILENALQYTTPVGIYIFYIAVIVFLLFIPGMENSRLKLGLYYIPPSIFCITNGLYALRQYRHIPNEKTSSGHSFPRIVIYTMILFSIAILCEDIFAIAKYTSYLDLKQRSISEDIMSIFYSLLAIIYLVRRINDLVGIHIQNESTDESISPVLSEAPLDITDDKESPKNEASDVPVHSLSKFFLFCKEYQLTTREQDIMTLLLKNMSNEEISEELGISLGTSKTHIHNIYLKVDVKKRRQLMEAYENFSS